MKGRYERQTGVVELKHRMASDLLVTSLCSYVSLIDFKVLVMLTI